MAEEDDSPLRRWSRRKREAARNPEPELESGDVSARPPEGDKESDAELIAALPDVDSLTLQSDFTVFLKSGVPTALRNRALARLWRMDPVFANLDGLNNYDEDYRAQMMATAGKKIASLFRVGRGMISPQEALEELEQLAKQTGDGDAAAAGREAQPSGASASDTEPAANPPTPLGPPAALSGPSGADRSSPGGGDLKHCVQSEIVDNSPMEDSPEASVAIASNRPRQGPANTRQKTTGGKAASRRWGRPS
ncbi:MAG: DUF3306 domain-containing protein [Kiloniellales bacterium]